MNLIVSCETCRHFTIHCRLGCKKTTMISKTLFIEKIGIELPKNNRRFDYLKYEPSDSLVKLFYIKNPINFISEEEILIN